MQNLRAVAPDLRFIPVVASIKFAIQIILVFAPGHTRHKLHDEAAALIFPNAFRHLIVDAIYHHEIRLEIVAGIIGP